MFGKSFLGTEQDKTEKIVVQGHRNTKRPVSGEAEEIRFRCDYATVTTGGR